MTRLGEVMSTDCEADALTTTPSRRLNCQIEMSKRKYFHKRLHWMKITAIQKNLGNHFCPC